jgi:Protein of unknown function (DUF2934)
VRYATEEGFMTNTGTAHSKTSGNSERGNVAPEQIQFRAYEIYMARGSASGSDVEDWLQAERELSQQNSRQDTAPQQKQNTQQNPQQTPAAQRSQNIQQNPQQNSNQQSPNPQQNQEPRGSSDSYNKPATRS